MIRTRFLASVSVVALAASVLAALPSAAGAAAGAAVGAKPAVGAPIPAPVAHGRLRIAGLLRDGGTVTARGANFGPPPLPSGDVLLSFGVKYTWRRCPAQGSGKCVLAADSVATPFAARSYVVGHADVGGRLRVTVTAIAVVQTDRHPFTFRVIRASSTATTRGVVGTFPGLRAAVGAVRQRDARGADRLSGGVFPGQRAALQHGGRAAGAVVPDRREQVAAAARQPGVLHRQAQAGGSFRGGPDREPVRPDDDPFPVAGRAAARAGGLPARARAALLVSAAPGLERQADALGLADRPDRSAAADRAAGGRHLRHRRVPDHTGPGVGYSLALAGEHAGASEGDLLPRPGLGGLPAGRVARAGSSRWRRWGTCTSASRRSGGSTCGS